MGIIYPKDGLSFEEFDRYWLEEHGPLISSLDIVKKGLLKYEQFHLSSAANEIFVAQGLAPPAFAGIAIFEAEFFEKITVFQHPEYIRLVLSDEMKFIMQREKCQLMAGQLATILGA